MCPFTLTDSLPGLLSGTGPGTWRRGHSSRAPALWSWHSKEGRKHRIISPITTGKGYEKQECGGVRMYKRGTLVLKVQAGFPEKVTLKASAGVTKWNGGSAVLGGATGARAGGRVRAGRSPQLRAVTEQGPDRCLQNYSYSDTQNGSKGENLEKSYFSLNFYFKISYAHWKKSSPWKHQKLNGWSWAPPLRSGAPRSSAGLPGPAPRHTWRNTPPTLPAPCALRQLWDSLRQGTKMPSHRIICMTPFHQFWSSGYSLLWWIPTQNWSFRSMMAITPLPTGPHQTASTLPWDRKHLKISCGNNSV